MNEARKEDGFMQHVGDFAALARVHLQQNNPVTLFPPKTRWTWVMVACLLSIRQPWKKNFRSHSGGWRSEFALRSSNVGYLDLCIVIPLCYCDGLEQYELIGRLSDEILTWGEKGNRQGLPATDYLVCVRGVVAPLQTGQSNTASERSYSVNTLPQTDQSKETCYTARERPCSVTVIWRHDFPGKK